MIWILPLTLLIVFEMVADVFAKSWSLQGSMWKAALALLCYLIANTFWLFALKYGSGLAKGAVIFSLVTGLSAMAIGLVIYKEPVTRLQFIGMILGLVSIMLIFWNDSL